MSYYCCCRLVVSMISRVQRSGVRTGSRTLTWPNYECMCRVVATYTYVRMKADYKYGGGSTGTTLLLRSMKKTSAYTNKHQPPARKNSVPYLDRTNRSISVVFAGILRDRGTLLHAGSTSTSPSVHCWHRRDISASALCLVYWRRTTSGIAR